ncbi:hypothetical protein Hanom_Chr17g01581031 [Helianthus anomalus]
MDKIEEQKMSEPHHNMGAYLDPQEKIVEFKEITRWLREKKPLLIRRQLHDVDERIMGLASVVEIDGKEVFCRHVNQQNVDVSIEILNTVL